MKEPELSKIFEDARGYIYLVNNLLKDGREFTFLEIKKGYARGGCLHSQNEYFAVIKGKVEYIHGEKKEILTVGEGGTIPANVPHAFVALEDSIVSEWGITSEEKKRDAKNQGLRSIVDRINSENKKV